MIVYQVHLFNWWWKRFSNEYESNRRRFLIWFVCCKALHIALSIDILYQSNFCIMMFQTKLLPLQPIKFISFMKINTCHIIYFFGLENKNIQFCGLETWFWVNTSLTDGVLLTNVIYTPRSHRHILFQIIKNRFLTNKITKTY